MQRFFPWLALAATVLLPPVRASDPPSDTPTVCQAGRHGDHVAGFDQDGDGVPDSEDWCARSRPGARVGPDGCAKGEVGVACDPGAREEPARVVPADPAPDGG